MERGGTSRRPFAFGLSADIRPEKRKFRDVLRLAQSTDALFRVGRGRPPSAGDFNFEERAGRIGRAANGWPCRDDILRANAASRKTAESETGMHARGDGRAL